ncbi:MAG: hypothetical protein H0S80_13505 [Desulfovibrionaceae bacterium]|nr:hypothetical protein [Desulfovibrionaceae bacterium]
MKKVALTISGKFVSRLLAVSALAVLLSGCAVVGPLLSLGGMAGLAPLQYVSAAYTLGEFSYEYAANDKTPNEVIQAKIDSVITGEAFQLPGDDESAVMVADAGTEAQTDGLAAEAAPQDPVLSEELRQKRIENLLGERRMRFDRLELRRMAFLTAQRENRLSLRQTAMAESPDLFNGAKNEVSLD